MASITATSQVSRFHTETIESSSRDVDMWGVTVAVGDTELLADAHLRLTAGQRYGLLGRNGVGKSTLLKAIGWNILVGFPRYLRCLYVDQLEGVDLSQTALQVVVGADVAAQRAQRDADALQAVLDDGDAADIALTLRKLELQRLEEEVTEATKIAEKRSGERGLAARQVLVAAEGRLAAARGALDAPVGNEELQGAMGAAQELLNDLFERLSLREPEEAEAQAAAILSGLGFSLEEQAAPLGQLSGGWRIRVSLAQALFIQPDLLLLDEPTNHLDLPGIVWLQRYLTRSLQPSTTLVVISHDRAFLNVVAQEVIVFKNRQLRYYNGNYDEYVQQVEERQLHQLRLADGIERKRDHVEKSIQEGLRQATKAGDDKKLGMVASRKKKLENRLGMEKNAAGHRLKVNKDFVGYFKTARQEAEIEPKEVTPPWKTPDPDPLRHKGPVVQLEAVSCGYNKSQPVLKDVTLCVEQGERVALLGPNGQGKSTLVKTLVGLLPTLAGTLQLHSSARLAYFQQSQVEEMCSQQQATALSFMQEKWPVVKEQEMRNFLGSFGIKGATATQPLATLSGGQAVRVALAAAFYSRPHLLILDEPSNHLDLEGVEALATALNQFTGSVLLVSHDQYLVQQAAQRTFLVSDGRLKLLEGGVQEYVAELGSSSSKKKKASSGGAKGGGGSKGSGSSAAGAASAGKGSKKAADGQRR